MLDELLPAVIHCLYDERWGARVAGVRCVGLLLDELPAELLWHYSPTIVHGLLLVTAALPQHSNAERRRVQALVVRLLGELYPATDTPPRVDDGNKDDKDDQDKVCRVDRTIKAILQY